MYLRGCFELREERGEFFYVFRVFLCIKRGFTCRVLVCYDCGCRESPFEGGVTGLEHLTYLILAIVAGVIVHLICKWLDCE